MLKSTSFHTLNADKNLSSIKRKFYLTLNKLNSQILNNYSFDNNMLQKKLPLTIDEVNIRKESPSRLLSNLFWSHIDWKVVEKLLGPLCILDLGCGNGGYAQRFMDWINTENIKYYGFDITCRDSWNSISSNDNRIKFKTVDSNQLSVEDIPEKTNLIVSQSALEHVEYDISLFKTIRKFVKNKTKPTIQIHLVPSEYTMKLYPFHGIRYCNQRMLSFISKLFADCSCSCVYSLGGAKSNQLHYEYITYPLAKYKKDFRITKPLEYSEALFNAINIDATNSDKSTSFYAFVIESFISDKFSFHFKTK